MLTMKEMHLKARDVVFLLVLALFTGVYFLPAIPCGVFGIENMNFVL